MDDTLTDRFCALVEAHGRRVLDDPRRFRALLGDTFPDRPAARLGLYTAVSERMVARLTTAAQSDRLESEAAILRDRLHDEFGLNEPLSDWVLVTLCAALGVALASKVKPNEPKAGNASGGGQGAQTGAFGIAQEHWLEGTPGEPGSVFREAPDAPEMVVIPAGSFVMGSPKEASLTETERPQRLVTFKGPFALGRYPVTFAEWDAARSRAPELHRPKDMGWGRSMRPAINVCWYDAKCYISVMNELTDGLYRLPSEAEWEYAARGGTTTPFWMGESISKEHATYLSLPLSVPSPVCTSPVGSVGAPNPFGLFDVHGNVLEWVEDVYVEVYSGAPVDGSARTSLEASCERVCRGGSWDGAGWLCRSAARLCCEPTERRSNIGFRLARTLTP